MRVKELIINESIILRGQIIWEDESYSDAFGFIKLGYYKVQNLEVYAIVGDYEIEITKSVQDTSMSLYESLEDKFLKEFR